MRNNIFLLTLNNRLIIFKKGLCLRHKKVPMVTFYQAFMPMACSFFLMLLLSSCEQKTQEKKFFDVPGYFRGEIDSLNKSDFSFRKISVYNGDTNKTELNSKNINWEKEFAIFIESDINKPVYYDNLIQTDLSDSLSKRVLYRSNSNKLTIVEVDIIWGFMREQVKLISVKINKDNLISSTQILAVYVKESRYFISGTQRIKTLGSTNKFFVEGQFSNF